MACGTPVLCSNVGSLKEVGGEAALYFDPKEIEDLQGEIIRVLTDKKLKENLIEKGLKRYPQFSWKVATQTLISYNNTLD